MSPQKKKTKRPAASTPAPKKKRSARAPARKASRPKKAAASPETLTATFPVELEAGRIDESLRKLGDELRHWANKGRYTRVRFKFRGKQLLPDIPLAAVVAAEGLSFYWAGLLRALVVNVAGGSLFQVELVNDADKRILEGREALLAGDADRALELFRKAAVMDRDNASAQLNIGIALKLKGDREGARGALARAKVLDPEGAVGQEAERVLQTLPAEEAPVQLVPLPGPAGAR